MTLPSRSDSATTGRHADTGHIPALDGLRGIAVLLVLWIHFWQLFPSVPGALEPVRRTATFGLLGVDLFFVLSGFLITRILLRAKGTPGYFSNFYARRALRIFPLYFGTLAVGYLLIPQLLGKAGTPFAQQAWYWFYAQNIAITFGYRMAGPTHFWSLAVEEQFYLVWPLLVAALLPSRLLRVALVIIALAVVCRVALLWAGLGVFYFTLARMDEIAAGGVLAMLEHRGLLHRHRRLIRLGAIASTVALLAIPLPAVGDHMPWVQVVKFSVAACCFACIIALCATARPGGAVERLLAGRSLRFTGRISYGMYVVHPFIFTGVHVLHLPGGMAGTFVGSFGLTYLIAYGSFMLYERPFLALKRYFPGAARAHPVSPVSARLLEGTIA
jgi:peptidoglycan/LPS O-acetylase OafA/YrhL